eukprot:g1770.t1
MLWTVVVHGGAGSIRRTFNNKPHEEALKRALDRAVAIVSSTETRLASSHPPKTSRALAAAIEAVVYMENDPLFNAGKGSCVNRAAQCEMEAAVMDSSMSSGACCGLTTVKNPTLLANYIRTETPHRFIGFQAAEAIAKSAGFERESPDWFIVDRRSRAQEKLAEKGAIARDHDTEGADGDTVGAVVLDSDGVLAGAVSTGGMTNKYEGRIGDSPCIGSGLYVTPLAAVCGSGNGEEFILHNACAQVCHAMKYGGLDLKLAVTRVLFEELPKESGGIIALSKDGEVVMDINCSGMFRAMANSDGDTFIGTW